MTTSSRTHALRRNFTAVSTFVGALLGFGQRLDRRRRPGVRRTVILAYGAVIGGLADDAADALSAR
jgi:hypothetical protein